MFKIMMGTLDLKKKPSDDDIMKIPPYIFCRWLSGNQFTVGASNQLNLYYNIPMVNQYNLMKSAFGGKIKYIPYPKNIKEDKSKTIEYLSDYFKISLEKAKEYLDFISADELKTIVDMYTEHELNRK